MLKLGTGMKPMQYFSSQIYRINLNLKKMNLELPVALYLFREFGESLLQMSLQGDRNLCPQF